jgi:phosphate starvation-inducible PhoH-like protein
LSEIILNIDSVDLSQLYGTNNINIQLLQEAYPDITITFRGNVIKLSGDKKSTQACKHKIELMVRALKEHNELQLSAVRDMLLQNENNTPPDGRISQQDHTNNVIVYGREGTPIKAKTRNQKKLVRLSEDNDVVFAIGPAGTGKTYTAVALAVRALKSKMVKKIILTRPAVEAGENLGFLPGDLKEKIDPYLRPPIRCT